MLESRSSYGYYGWAGGATGENEPVSLACPHYEERCANCPYLVENENGEWVCDIDEIPCGEIEYCPAVEEDDCDNEVGYDPYLGCYTDDV